MVDFVQINKKLAARLRQAEANDEVSRYRAVIMHDFALDRLVHIDAYDRFDQTARTVLARKGGLLPKSRQTLQQGGCAANTATTLGRLGVQTYFMTRTDELGLALLEFYLQRAGVDLSHVKLGGRLGLMTALEIGAEKINIMINDDESFGPFGFDDLDSKDLQLIESVDLVGVFDWCLNPQGTDLAGRLFDYLQEKDMITYLDTSDPTPRHTEIPELFNRVLVNPGLDYLNLNENELKQYAGAVEAGESLNDLFALARSLKVQIPAILNVHTSSFALCVDQNQAWVPTYRLDPRRTTGAGDSWNGGNILGLLLELEPEERLLLANAVAGYYIVSPQATRPTLSELITFIETHQGVMHEIA